MFNIVDVIKLIKSREIVLSLLIIPLIWANTVYFLLSPKFPAQFVALFSLDALRNRELVYCITSFGRPKTRTLSAGNSTWSFLGNPYKLHSLRFWLTPGNSECYLFDTPGNSISSAAPPPLFVFFSGIAHFS